jgi:hypothetical protein
MVYGRDPVLPTDEALSKPADHCYHDADEYRSEVLSNLQNAWSTAKKNVEQAQKGQKKQHDRKARMPTFVEGDRVFVFKPAAKSGKAYKFARPFHGPYRIKLYDNGADVRPVDRPQEASIRVLFDRLRVCPEEIPNQSWPPSLLPLLLYKIM